jgi:hypothetical protein
MNFKASAPLAAAAEWPWRVAWLGPALSSRLHPTRHTTTERLGAAEKASQDCECKLLPDRECQDAERERRRENVITIGE